MTLHPGRPPFGGQGSLCASSLHAASYTLLPLRGISPQGETRDCAAEPCSIEDGEITKHRRTPSSGGTRRYGWQGLGALLKRRVERSPATMGRVRWSCEISPLRSVAVEMTGRYHIFLHGPFGFRTDGETISPFTGLYQQRGEKAGPKSFLCRSAQSMEAERGGQKPS